MGTDLVKKILGHKHSSDPKDRAMRNVVRTIACPYCGAEAGQHCIGARGQKRYASHQERWDTYRKTKDNK